MDSRIWIGRATRSIGSQPPVHVSSLGIHWFVGFRRSKIASLYLPLRPSMLPWRVVVLEWFGWRGHLGTIDSSTTRCLSYVTTRVPSRSPTTRFSMGRRSILKSRITSSGITLLEVTSDILTNPLDEKRFIELRHELNIIDSSNAAWPPCSYTIYS
jgi:hypothetical protein